MVYSLSTIRTDGKTSDHSESRKLESGIYLMDLHRNYNKLKIYGKVFWGPVVILTARRNIYIMYGGNKYEQFC